MAKIHQPTLKRIEHADLLGVATGAVFSPCLRYRYRLWRRWDLEKPACNFIMLNPSTADELTNDPTVERCERRAKMLGFGSLEVTNLFAWRATDPEELWATSEPVGPANDEAIWDAAQGAKLVIVAWGVNGALDNRGRIVLHYLRSLADPRVVHCLGRTSNGFPRHPLYVPYEQQPEPFSLADGDFPP